MESSKVLEWPSFTGITVFILIEKPIDLLRRTLHLKLIGLFPLDCRHCDRFEVKFHELQIRGEFFVMFFLKGRNAKKATPLSGLQW